MALTPPESRHWYKEPLHKMEVVWITIAFLWGLVMFFTMVYWHINGTQNLSNEAYRVIPEEYGEKVEAFAEKYKVREEADIPVVKPPAGSDVYLLGRLWEWWPILELEKGKTYRLHMSSMDWQHGFSLQPANINILDIQGLLAGEGQQTVRQCRTPICRRNCKIDILFQILTAGQIRG